MIDWWIDWLLACLVGWLVGWVTRVSGWLMDWCIVWLVHQFRRSFIDSRIDWFIGSWIQSVNSVSSAWIPSSPFIHNSTTTCSFIGPPHKFNTSLLLAIAKIKKIEKCSSPASFGETPTSHCPPSFPKKNCTSGYARLKAHDKYDHGNCFCQFAELRSITIFWNLTYATAALSHMPLNPEDFAIHMFQFSSILAVHKLACARGACQRHMFDWSSHNKLKACFDVHSIKKCWHKTAQFWLAWRKWYDTLRPATSIGHLTIQQVNPTWRWTSMHTVGTPVNIAKGFEYPNLPICGLATSMASNWFLQDNSKITCIVQVANHLSKFLRCNCWNTHFLRFFFVPQKTHQAYPLHDTAASLPPIDSGRFLHRKMDLIGLPSGLCCHMESFAAEHVQNFVQTTESLCSHLYMESTQGRMGVSPACVWGIWLDCQHHQALWHWEYICHQVSSEKIHPSTSCYRKTSRRLRGSSKHIHSFCTSMGALGTNSCWKLKSGKLWNANTSI